MQKIRIGCASGGCAYERIEPAIELITRGAVDYIVFECLAERTMANAQREKLNDPTKGYNPMLEERMTRLLPLLQQTNTKLISNMGAANTPCAVAKIKEITQKLKLSGFKIAMITGDDIFSRLHHYQNRFLLDREISLKELQQQVISANAYLGNEAITEALDHGADIVITGRVADVSLFTGITQHAFKWDKNNHSCIGQAILLGHLMECAGQLTGGYYADPSYKEVPDLHLLGFPIAEINAQGDLFFTKTEGSGGIISTDICKEQLLYEITDPAHYITPDGIADFSKVTFTQTATDRVTAKHATIQGYVDTYKINIGYQDCYIGEAAISFGGSNAINRARLAAEIVQKRLELINVHPESLRIDYIGHDSLYKPLLSEAISGADINHEIRLRIAARTKTRAEAVKVTREVECLYINGPAGGAGIRSSIESVISIDNIIIPRADIQPMVSYIEV